MSPSAPKRVLSNASQGLGTSVLPYPVRLPPGVGLYVYAATAGGGVNVTYDLVV